MAKQSASEYWRARRERDKTLSQRLPGTGWLPGRQRPITERYCFCPGTPLWANRCPTCGKAPYTD